jgi:undecaprenyldiphospho-muramoylpentapeptide beta-N-acetylglucosaminyltransferase|tara:strand:+ start:5857 stop:7011 length:1155 start_codon:yes stop_codon:yes gene_type:complete
MNAKRTLGDGPRRGGILIAGGGTAGHVLPGLAVAAALVERGVVAGRSDVHLVGSRRGVEVELVPAAGFGLTVLGGRGIQRRLTPANVGALIGLLAGFLRAFLLLSRARPRVVLSLGGYASIPCGLAAVALRVPLVVAEQNAVPGAANRLLGRFARACAVSFAGTALPRPELTGNPVRASIRSAVDTRVEARDRLGVGERSLLVAFGGSLGARRLNRAVADFVEGWGGGPLVVRHVVGSRGWSAGEMATELPAGVEYLAVAYEHDMPTLLAAADLVVCRSGATSVAELAVLGVPSVLVPLPGAPGDHQTANARHLSESGGAVLLADADLDGSTLDGILGRLLADAPRRDSMAASARSTALPDAADRVVDLILRHATGRCEDVPDA